MERKKHDPLLRAMHIEVRSDIVAAIEAMRASLRLSAEKAEMAFQQDPATSLKRYGAPEAIIRFYALVERHFGLVGKIAGKFRESHQSIGPDLMQAGRIGLMLAIGRYRPSKGSAFSTYASFWIRKEIFECLPDRMSDVQRPTGADSIIRNIKITCRAFESERGRLPTTEELAAILKGRGADLSVETLHEYVLMANESSISLDMRIAHTNVTGNRAIVTMHDIVPTPDVSQEERVLGNERARVIRELIAGLSPRERDIIELRYGFRGEELNKRETGLLLVTKISRERVRQIEEHILSRFRALLEPLGIAP